MNINSQMLTQRQMLIWAGHNLAPHIPVSNMVMAFELNGAINEDRFKDSFDKMVEKTDILRTVFVLNERKEPCQLVLDSINYSAQYIDFSLSEEPEKKCQSWISQEAVKVFDVESCCFGSCLIKLSEQSFLWFFCQHHLITDGATTRIIYERTREIYEGSQSKLSSSYYPYSAYLASIEKYKTSQTYLNDKKYWSEKLAEPLEPLRLYGRNRTFSAQTQRVEIRLGQQRTLALKALASEHVPMNVDFGMFVVLTTILYANLHLASGNKRIGVGAPMHNRSPKFKYTAGIMMEVCPLVIDFDDNETFKTLLDKVTTDSFDTIRSSQFTTTNPAHAKVYDVSLNFLNPVFSDFDGASTKITYETGLNRMTEKHTSEGSLTAGESVSIIVNDFSKEDDYLIYFDFNTGIFDEVLQRRTSNHFMTLLDAFIGSVDTPLQSVELLSTDERQYLLKGINNTKTAIQGASVIDRLEEYAETQGDKLALIFEATHLSYSSLNKRVNKLAHHLISMGVKEEVLVGVFLERSADLLVALLAIIKTGAAYVPFDPHHPASRIEIILEDAKPSLLLVDSQAKNTLKVDQGTRVIVLEETWTTSHNETNPGLEFCNSRLAYTIFTSGSTGRPKGVQIQFEALNNFLHSMAATPGLSCDDRLLSVTTISFDIAALEMYLPILVGATLEIADQNTVIDPNRLQDKLEKTSVIQATPATFRMLIQNGWAGGGGLKVLCGGEAFPRDLADKLLAYCSSVWNMYGPTETTIWSTVDQVSPGDNVSIGSPIANTQVYVLNRCRVPVPQGCIGELYIAGDGLARGYHERSDLTQEVFVENPFSSKSGALMYRTGDLARILPDGKLECLGRVDFQVKLRGFRIEIGEIETLLGQQKEVEQNVVVVQGENENKRLVAYVSLTEEISAPALRDRLKNVLPSYMVPSMVVIMEALPLTPNGKIDRKKLPEPDESDHLNASRLVEPKTETEKNIASIWRDILDVSGVGIDDNFFDVGGHSLLAVRVANNINAFFNSDIALSRLFEAPTIRELAQDLVENECGSVEGEGDSNATENRATDSKLKPAEKGFLTPRQTLMWTGSQLAPDVPANNMVMLAEINGEINLERFNCAFNRMLTITDVLRTVFVPRDNNEPYQEVKDSIAYTVSNIDFSENDFPERDLQAWIDNNAVKPFDLEKCGFNCALLKQSDQRFVWFFCQHHILTDGSSVQAIYDRVNAFYRNAQAEPEAVPTYADYLADVHKYQHSLDYVSDEKYWTEKLSEPLEPLKIYGRQPNLSTKTQRLTLKLDADCTKKFKRNASRILGLNGDLEVFIAFSTILYANMYLSSGNKRIGLGAPMHNRPPKFKNTAGLMMEVSPIIVEFDEDETFSSLMGKIRKDTLATIVASRFTTRNSSNSRAFSVSLNFLNPVFSDFDGHETSLIHDTGLNRARDSDSSDIYGVTGEILSVTVNDFSDGGEYHVYFDFNTGAFDLASQYKMRSHFQALLDAFIESPETPLLNVNLLSDIESNYLLGELNSTAVADVRPSLVKQLETCALNHPDRTAAIFNSDTISYRALNLRVNQLANQLLLGGVSPEISVGIFMERSLNLLVALLATIKSGGAYVPLDPHHPSDRIELILEDAKPKMLLVDDLNSKKLKILPETKVIVLNSSSFEGGDSSNPTDSFDENRLAYTIFTSGSTGRPKGVQISHAALQNFLYAMAARPGLSAADRLLSVTTISFDIAALEMYLPILVGACVDIADQACTLDPGRLAERIKQATVVQATPATFRMLIADGWQGHTNLNVLCGGEAFPRDLADQLLERSKTVWNMYGPTETTIWSCVDQVQSGKLVAIGSPIDNTQVYVLNSARVPVPQGCIGELYIAGDGLARGYHERDDLTAEVFVSNPFSKEPNALMYRTGDLARILSDGKLECLGRVDFQVKLRGFRIELGEIETLLGQQPEVNQNVVVVKGEHDSRQLVAYVSLSAPIDPMVLKDRLKKGLPHYMVPSIILILDDLPLTPNGKIDRKKLPNPDLNDLSIHDVLTEAQTETEKTIAEIWKKILNKETVGIDQNFFDIGGYSLSAIRVLGEINKACDGQLSLNAFFETPTIRELASRAENNETTADASVITLKEGKGDSPLFCICGINMYQALADNIQSDDPVYGVFLSQETDMWLESSSGTTPTVKTLAHGYVAAIKDKQEVGPYNLTGVSFGGVLAFEVAQQLHGMGDEVNVLALLDSYLPHAVKRRAHLRLVHHFLNIRELGIGYAISVSKKWLAKVPLLSRIFSAHSLKKDSQELEGSYEDQVVLRRKSYKKAMRVYSQDMQQYHSSATFFAAGHRHRDFVGREVMKCGGWEGIIKQLDVIDVTGGHIEILKEPHVKTIAVAITKKMHPNI